MTRPEETLPDIREERRLEEISTLESHFRNSITVFLGKLSPEKTAILERLVKFHSINNYQDLYVICEGIIPEEYLEDWNNMYSSLDHLIDRGVTPAFSSFLRALFHRQLQGVTE